MVHFPASTAGMLSIHMPATAIPGCRVTPFGDPGIEACWRLPRAYRSYPRPSSPGSS